MAGGRGGGGRSGNGWLRGALIIFVGAAVLSVFSKRTEMQRPVLSAVNIVGIALMVVGLALTLLAFRIAEIMSRSGRDVAPIVKMAGVLVCGVGAALVFL